MRYGARMAKFRRKSPPVNATREGDTWSIVDAAGTITTLSHSLFCRTYKPLDDEAYALLGIARRRAAQGAFGRSSATDSVPVPEDDYDLPESPESVL